MKSYLIADDGVPTVGLYVLEFVVYVMLWMQHKGYLFI